jgi:glycosyltransferase involved in cell wall biosynthesis
MRILFVIDSLGFGGAERQLVELIKELSRSNYELTLACTLKVDKGYTHHVLDTGTPIYYFSRRYKFDLIVPLLSLKRLIDSHQFDVIHGFMNMGSLLAVLAGKMTRTPVVSSAIRDAKDQNLKVKILKRMIAILSDIFVSNTQAGLNNRFRRPASKHRVIYNGVDLKRFDRPVDIQALRACLGVGKFRRILLSVSSFSENKDHLTLLQAFKLVLESNDEVCMLLVGDGPGRRQMEAFANHLGIGGYVRFTGYRDDVDEIYQVADICILSTNTKRHLEGISNALLEAMASGTPVIATRGGGTNEVIEDGVNGQLIPAGDSKAIALIINRSLRTLGDLQKMAAAGKKTVESSFTLEKYVKANDSLYREVVR